MDQAQMTDRCPNATLLGPVSLRDYRLDFTIYSERRGCGCADIVSAPGETVYGLLYSISEDEMALMDTFEGHPVHYQRITVDVNDKGIIISAYSYEVVKKQSGLRPSKHYLGLITSAALLHQFPSEFITMLEGIKTID